MRSIRFALVAAVAVFSTACFQMSTVLRISGDGSGTINHRMIYSTQALAQLRQFAAFGRGRGGAIDPLSEDQFRNMAASIGPGVTYVKSELITTPAGQGRDATFAFTDVSKLQISTQPAAPGGVSISAGGLSTSSESVTFSLSREAAGTTVLHIHVPEPNFLDALGSPAAANQIGMVKTMLAGAKLLLAAEPDGALVKTSSPFVAGNRVTLLEIDVDEMLKDETLLPRLQAAKTQDEAKAIVQKATGLKINLDRDITIEFTPAK